MNGAPLPLCSRQLAICFEPPGEAAHGKSPRDVLPAPFPAKSRLFGQAWASSQLSFSWERVDVSPQLAWRSAFHRGKRLTPNVRAASVLVVPRRRVSTIFFLLKSSE